MRRFSQRSHLVTLNEINITPLLDLAPSAPDLLFAATPDAVAAALAQALDAPADPARRRTLARPHDWDALAARMVAEIEARLAVA